MILLAGEISTNAKLDFDKIVRDKISRTNSYKVILQIKKTSLRVDKTILC